MTNYKKVKEIAYEDICKALQNYSHCFENNHSNESTMKKAELDMYSAMQNYLKACHAEMHSKSVKRGIKAAKERKAKLAKSEVVKND